MESELQEKIKNAQTTYINSLISSFSSKPLTSQTFIFTSVPTQA